MSMPLLSRRHWLALATGSVASLRTQAAFCSLPDDGEKVQAGRGQSNGSAMIVRTQRPLNLESPRAALDSWFTPNDRFFVRSHFGAPSVSLGPWEVEITGMVERSLKLSLDELFGRPQTSVPAVLQCAGNGRAHFQPRVPGVGWERGAVGHAEWSGVSLATLLDQAGVREGAAHVHFLGADAPPNPKMSAFVRSIPLARARVAGTVLALKMNDEALPVLHGGPVRLVVPGWSGNNWLKWIRRIVVSKDEAPGFYMQTAYRLPREPKPQGATVTPAEMEPVEWLNVKSLITSPLDQSAIDARAIEVCGIAFTGAGHVTSVEFSTDRDPRWQAAELAGDPREGSWRQFRMTWKPDAPGRYVLRVRATDSRGNVQPETPPWNKSGYLWNGFDRVACTVR
jgi:DMSO/TMAO reductase YedYZ molybdopterin-dependent catalytic subunit